jgi:hypothetical protein
MAKVLSTILINDLQMSCLNELRKQANDKGVVKAAVLLGFKNNVTGALIRHGVLSQRANGDVRIMANPVALRPPHVPRPSTLAKRAAVVQEQQIAA